MAALGLLLLLIKGGLIYYIFSLAYGSSFFGGLMVLLFFGGLGALVWRIAPTQLADAEHEIECGVSAFRIRIPPTLAVGWTFALGSMDSDQTLPQRIINIAMMVPKLFWTSWWVFRRIKKVKQIDVENCGRVLRLVLKRSERVEVAEVAEELKKIPAAETMNQLALIDGVVFLTKESVGITLANRLKDDIEAAQRKSDSAPPADDSPFAS